MCRHIFHFHFTKSCIFLQGLSCTFSSMHILFSQISNFNRRTQHVQKLKFADSMSKMIIGPLLRNYASSSDVANIDKLVNRKPETGHGTLVFAYVAWRETVRSTDIVKMLITSSVEMVSANKYICFQYQYYVPTSRKRLYIINLY